MTTGAPGDEGLWQLVFEHSPVGMTLVGLDGRLLVVNRALCEMLGYSAEELMSKGFQEITHPDDLDSDLQLFHQTLAGERDDYRMRKRYLHRDGWTVWGDLSVTLMRDATGQPLRFVSQILDVTEQREYAAALRAANTDLDHERLALEAIFETVDLGLLLIDKDGNYERMNRRHEEAMRLPYPDGHAGVAGQPGHVFRADGVQEMRPDELPSWRAAQGEEFDDVRLWVGRDAPSRRAFSVSARNVHEPDGSVRGAVLAYKDITDLMRAMQVKDDFVASVSHELRTPLTSVLGHLEMLTDREDLPDDVGHQLQVVERNAVRLRALVADLLEVAQEREGVRVDLAELDLRQLVLDATESARPAADACGVHLVVDVPQRVVARVDGQRLRQVVDNLLSNAIKYTDAGGRVSVALTLAPSGRHVELSVSDTGIGIDPADRDQVFDRFFRGAEVQARHIQGTGLGLSIVSSIVAAHGGTVSLDSEPGVGSTFRVTLPHAVV